MADDYITASEIGEFLYCQRAWWYRKQGAPSAQIEARSRGTEQHEQLAQDVVQTERGNRLAWQLILVGIALFVVFLILAVWGRGWPSCSCSYRWLSLLSVLDCCGGHSANASKPGYPLARLYIWTAEKFPVKRWSHIAINSKADPTF